MYHLFYGLVYTNKRAVAEFSFDAECNVVKMVKKLGNFVTLHSQGYTSDTYQQNSYSITLVVLRWDTGSCGASCFNYFQYELIYWVYHIVSVRYW